MALSQMFELSERFLAATVVKSVNEKRRVCSAFCHWNYSNTKASSSLSVWMCDVWFRQ